MKYQQIKVKKKHLYSYYCEVIIMWVDSENSVKLSSTLYVFEFEVNFLLKKWMCKIRLYRSFNQHCFQMCNKYSKIIIKTLKWDEIYIVKYIAKSFNKFALIFVVHTSHSEIVFSAAVSDMSSYVQIYKHDFIIKFSNVDTALLNEKIKTYRL